MRNIDRQWLRLPEAARVAGVSEATLRRLATWKEGGQPAPRIPHARRGNSGRGGLGQILIDKDVAQAVAQKIPRPPPF